ncbi:MAG: PEP-CTERM sorting domain-containing protein [Burkholderiaceae bacterium]|jgi:hypothetical protein|nr:PEP-CTERM sorting domain-containing protein [Burkholderiaceae bacterium]
MQKTIAFGLWWMASTLAPAAHALPAVQIDFRLTLFEAFYPPNPCVDQQSLAGTLTLIAGSETERTGIATATQRVSCVRGDEFRLRVGVDDGDTVSFSFVGELFGPGPPDEPIALLASGVASIAAAPDASLLTIGRYENGSFVVGEDRWALMGYPTGGSSPVQVGMVQVVPEPATTLLLLVALAGMGTTGAMRSRR